MTSPQKDTRNKGVTRDLVLAAAEQLLDDGGLERLSMRRVALHLGVTPMALYNHVQDKDELLALLADHLRSQVRVDTSLPVREQLVHVLVQLRDLGARHPALLGTPRTDSASRHAVELALVQLRLLRDLGLTAPQVRAAYRNLVLLVTGAAVVWRASAQHPASASQLRELAVTGAGAQDRLLLDALDALPEQTADDAFVEAVHQVLRSVQDLPPR